MIDLVAKRYVKALMADRSVEDLTVIYNELKTISTAYGDDKFLHIIGSTEVAQSSKVDLILSFLDSCSDATKNIVKLLGNNKRLDIIPSIVETLNKELSILNNTYEGIVYTNAELSSADMDKINAQFAQKLNVNLQLTQNVCDYDGIKVDIDGLGCEISFSKERLKSQMIEHILKAV
jgi:F-type H+-transporting ATPase subunit delta